MEMSVGNAASVFKSREQKRLFGVDLNAKCKMLSDACLPAG
jgi:hypothetical protein